jgi:hypothetical protein
MMVIGLSTATEDIPALGFARSKAARVKARPRPDTALTPPGTQYGATLSIAEHRKSPRYGRLTSPVNPRNGSIITGDEVSHPSLLERIYCNPYCNRASTG